MKFELFNLNTPLRFFRFALFGCGILFFERVEYEYLIVGEAFYFDFLHLVSCAFASSNFKRESVFRQQRRVGKFRFS